MQDTALGIAGGIGLMLLFVSSSLAQTADGGYRTFRTDGPGPHPAIVFVSGCSGFTPAVAPGAYERVAAQLRAHGYLVIFADYLGRRGLTSCAGAPITHADAAKDIVAAAAWLKLTPYGRTRVLL
jgi:dienelactone hydrolase